jgi:hypothetical protein
LSTTPNPSHTSPAAEAAASEAKDVGATAAYAAGDVASTTLEASTEVAAVAKEQAAQVLGDSIDEAKDLASSVAATVKEQFSTQSGKVSEQLSALSEQLTAGDTSGVVGQVMSEAGQRLRTLADHLQSVGPEGVLSDLRAYARRNPGSFLLGAAAAGLVTGRLVKGLGAGSTPQTPAGPTSAPALPTYQAPPSPAPVADPYPPTTVLGGVQ